MNETHKRKVIAHVGSGIDLVVLAETQQIAKQTTQEIVAILNERGITTINDKGTIDCTYEGYVSFVCVTTFKQWMTMYDTMNTIVIASDRS